MEQGRFEEAIEHLVASLRDGAEDPAAHLWIGRALAVQGEGASAAQHLREAARLAPTWPIPSNSAAWTVQRESTYGLGRQHAPRAMLKAARCERDPRGTSGTPG